MRAKKSPKSRPARKEQPKGGAIVKKGPGPMMPAIPEIPVEVGLNMQSLMAQAIDRQVPIEYLKQLVELFNEQKAVVAKQKFNEALAEAQAEFPIIEKKTRAEDHTGCTTCRGKGTLGDGSPCPDGKLLYVYAQYGDIVEKIGPIVSRHGFSATMRSKPSKSDLGTMMAGTCIVRHKDGHQEETTIEVPIGEGNRLLKGMQLYMATATFAERYAYKKAFGVAERGEDVVDSGEEPPAEPQAREGIQTDEHGKKTEAPLRNVTPVVDLKQARAELQRCLNSMGQIYSEGWKPLTDASGDPVISATMAKRLFPQEKKYNRLFSDEELNAYQRQGSEIKNDAAKMEEALLDWTAALAERKADLLGRVMA